MKLTHQFVGFSIGAAVGITSLSATVSEVPVAEPQTAREYCASANHAAGKFGVDMNCLEGIMADAAKACREKKTDTDKCRNQEAFRQKGVILYPDSPR